MMLASSANVSSGMINERNSKRTGKSMTGMSKMGISGRKKNTDPNRKHNIDKIRDQSSRSLPEEFHYKPKVSESFLEEWLDFPVDHKVSVLFNSAKMWLVWLIWTSKGMAGLDPGDTSIRARVCSQLSVLGTAAGLFLVIAIAGFLVPPELKHESDKIYVDIFGCLMFTASLCLIFYIGVSLTATYPLIESLRDDIAFDAFENYQNRVGGSEAYLFLVGMIFVTIALLVAAKILYSEIALYVMLFITAVINGVVTHLSRQIFLALDPISAMHMGLSNNPEVQHRAELLSHFILRKIPNSIVDGSNPDEVEVFTQKRESQKYEHTKSKRVAAELETAKPPAGEDEVHSFTDNGHTAAARKEVAHDWKAAKVAESDGMDVVDLEGSAVPLVSQRKPGISAHPSLTSEMQLQSGVKMPSLREMFADPDNYWFRSVDVSLAESAEVYAALCAGGCKTAEELVAYLDDHKELRTCTCSADRATAAHERHCHTRQSSAWTGALRNAGVASFTARKIVLRLESCLK